MNVLETKLPGVVLIETRAFPDDRGYFLETWNRRKYTAAGLPPRFVQDNVSYSKSGVLRGLHYQYRVPQGKLVQVLQGEVYDVALDIRPGSPTFGRWEGAILSAENRRQLYIPEGFAHGFAVTSQSALLCYKCTDFYDPDSEGCVRWDDPDLGIDWPIATPILSAKDQVAPPLREIPAERLPRVAPGERPADVV